MNVTCTSTATSRTDDLVRKVTGLLDKAESTTNAHEADAFLNKALELMAKASIDEAMIAAHRDAANAPDDPMVEHKVSVGKGPYCMARLDLICNIARSFNVTPLTSTNSWTGRSAFLLGHESDVNRVKTMYTALLTDATRAMAKEPVPGNLHGTRFRRSFLVGYAWEIGDRLRKRTAVILDDEAAAAKAAAESSESTPTSTDNPLAPISMALALRDRKEKVSDFVNEKYPRLRSGSGSYTSSDSRGTAAGRAAGARANLSTSVGGGSRGAIG